MPTHKEIVSSKFGNVIFSAQEILDKEYQVFSVSPAVDIALSGGIPEGCWVSLIGPPGCGKSTTALQILAETQKEKYNLKGKQRPSFYLDVEHRLKPMNLYGVHGLNPSTIEVIHSVPDKQLTAEDFLTILTQIIRHPDNFGGVAVIDSTSALCPSGEVVEDVCGTIRSTQPRIMASFIRQMAGVVRSAQFTIIMIQHLITNTSGWGEKLQVDGGEKLKYQCDVKLLTKSKPLFWGGDERRPTGQVIEWDVIKSALGQSGLSCKSYLRYGYGLDEAKEICDLAVELAVIKKSGSWFKMDYNGEEKKVQGEDKLYHLLQSDPKMLESLFSQSKAILGIDI